MLVATKRNPGINVAACLVAASCPVFADVPESLILHVEVHKSIVLVGEPLFVSARVVNVGSEQVKLIHHNAPTFESSLSIVDLRTGTDPNRLEHWSDSFRPVLRTTPRLVSPGESVQIEFVMLFNAKKGFWAKEPGTYWIQGRIVAQGIGEILSPPIEISVRAPNAVDNPVWKWLHSHQEDYGELVQVSWVAKPSPDFLKGCENICESSNSNYAEYMALFLSRWYGEGSGRDRAKAARYAEIAQEKASTETVRTLASRALHSPAAVREETPRRIPDQPVEDDVRIEVEAMFQEYIAAATDADIERCLKLQAENFRGWSRAKQREELQEDIDKINELRRQGVSAGLSARVRSVVQSEEDVLITALVSYHRGSKPPEDHTVVCRVRKYDDKWLLQDWSIHLPKK